MGKRKERSPEEQERRTKIRELLELSGVSSMTDIQELFKETIAEFMEDGLEAELSEALGYSKYDYKHKETEKQPEWAQFQEAAHQLWRGGRLHSPGPEGRV